MDVFKGLRRAIGNLRPDRLNANHAEAFDKNGNSLVDLFLNSMKKQKDNLAVKIQREHASS